MTKTLFLFLAAGLACQGGPLPMQHLTPAEFSVSSDIDFGGYQRGAGNGHFADGTYIETTQKYSVTVWTFAQPIQAFSGFWDFPTVNAGLQIVAGGQSFFPTDSAVAPLSSYAWNARPEWPEAGWSGVWEFTLDQPVSSFEIFSGDAGFPDSFSQTYKLSDVQVATAVPEPRAYWLLVLGGAALAWRCSYEMSRKLRQTEPGFDLDQPHLRIALANVTRYDVPHPVDLYSQDSRAFDAAMGTCSAGDSTR